MAVSTTTTKHTYDGNDLTTEFPYTFPISTTDGSDVLVYLTNADGEVSLITTGYTIDVLAQTITYPTVIVPPLDPLPTGWKITIARVEDLTQLLDLITQGSFNADIIEAAFDKITMIAQQIKEEVSRCPKYPIDETPSAEDTDEFINTVTELKNDAETAKTAAELAEAHAETAETNAETAETNAEAAQVAAQAAQTAAELAETHAETAETNAETAETAAELAETNAEAAQVAAEAAKDAAVIAQTAAELAETHAETAETNAETAETNAETAETNAETAETNAETARDQAAAYAASAAGIPIATAAGTVDAITADYAVNMTLTDLAICAFVASGANTSATPTFAPDGLTAHTITKRGGSALIAGDIPAAGYVCIVEYNLASTRWELLNPAFPVYLDTDTALAANSDARIASQKAVKAYADTKGDMKYADTRVSQVSFTIDMAVAGNTAVTGVGFAPKAVIYFVTDLATAGLSFWGIARAAASAAFSYDNNNRVANTIFAGSGLLGYLFTSGSVYNAFDIVSMDADGITVSNTKTGLPTGTAYFKCIFIR